MNKVWIACDWHLYSTKPNNQHPFRTKHSIGKLGDNYGYMVDETDFFIYLGDLCDFETMSDRQIQNVKDIISNIRGYKIMCRGNHDTMDDSFYLDLGFDEIYDIAIMGNIVYSHKPVAVYPNQLNIHAHLHYEKYTALDDHHINAYGANYQKEDQPVEVGWLIQTASNITTDPDSVTSRKMLGNFHECLELKHLNDYDSIGYLDSLLYDYPVDETASEYDDEDDTILDEILFSDISQTKYFEADDSSYQKHLDSAEYDDSKPVIKVAHKNDVVAESSSGGTKEYKRMDDIKPIDREDKKRIADKYGIRPIGMEDPKEAEEHNKSPEDRLAEKREARNKQLKRARSIKKRKATIRKIKSKIPFVKNESTVDDSDVPDMEVENSPLYGQKKNFFYNYDYPKEYNSSAEKLSEMAYEDYCDHFAMKLKSLASEYNKRDDIFKHVAKILKMDQNDLPKFECHVQVSGEKQLCFSMVNPDTSFEIKCEYEKYLKEMIKDLENDKETQKDCPHVSSIWTADAEGTIYIDLDYEHINEAAIKRVADNGTPVPMTCPKCGSKIGLYLKGEPVWLCSNKKCGAYYGTAPMNEAANGSYDLNMNQINEAIQQLITVKVKESRNPNDNNAKAVDLSFYQNGHKIGEAGVSGYESGKGFLYNMEVSKKYRGKGYGIKIMQYILSHYKVSDLSVDANNIPAIKLYTKFGFKRKKSFYDKTQKKTFDWYQREPVLLDESFHADTFLIEPKTFFGSIKLYHISRSKLTKIIPGSINVGNRLQVKPRMSSWWTPYYKRQAAWMLMVELKSKYGVDKATRWNNFSWTTVYDQEMQRNAPQVVIRKKFYEDHKREIDNFKVYVHEKIFKGNELGLGVEYSTKEYTCDEPITPDKVFILQLDDFRDYITIADDAEFKQLTARFAEAKKNHKHLSDILDVDKPWYYYDYETAKQKKLKQDHIISETSHKSIIDSNHKQHGQINLNSLTRIDITEKWRKEHTAQYPYLKHIASSDDEIDASAWLDDDKLVAIISVDRIPSKRNKIWIHDIHIDDKYRGYGLSKQLLDYAINNYKANALAVKIDNKLAQKVYLDYGFSFGSGKDDTMGNSKIMYLNESSIQDSYQFELLDKNVHFYDKIDEAASYQAKGKLYPVYVMLVHSGTTVSNLIKTISHSEYSHASISFDSSMDRMYSFARKDPRNPFIGGFRYESIGKGFYEQKEVPYAVYMVPCTESQIKRMKKRLAYFEKNKDDFTFDFSGLVTNYLGIVNNPEHRWFCSRFVSDVLNAGAPKNAPYVKNPSLQDPDDFTRDEYALYITSGENLMKYDKKKVDKITNKLLREYKMKKMIQNENVLFDLDPNLPYTGEVLEYQLTMIDESVVDNFLQYMRSFHIQLDKDGNVILTRRVYNQLDRHFKETQRMLKLQKKTGDIEGMKLNLAKLNYIIGLIDEEYLQKSTVSKSPTVRKDMLDLRSVMLNVLKQYLQYVIELDPKFNFQSYYNSSVYGKEVRIPISGVVAIGKSLKTLL